MKEEAPAKVGRLKNIDRKNGTVHEVTVDNVTISITEYRIKPRKERSKADSGGGGAESSKNGGGSYSAGTSNRNSDADSDNQVPYGLRCR